MHSANPLQCHQYHRERDWLHRAVIWTSMLGTWTVFRVSQIYLAIRNRHDLCHIRYERTNLRSKQAALCSATCLSTLARLSHQTPQKTTMTKDPTVWGP